MIDTGAAYHWHTAYARYGMERHFLDWENQPNPFKEYASLEPVPLPAVSGFPQESLWSLVSPPADPAEPKRPGMDLIARLLYLAGGLTAKSRHAGKVFYFRSAASAGALYPIELYLGVFNVEDREPGIYHFGVRDFTLSPMRPGDFSPLSGTIIPALPAAQHPCLSVHLTGIFFRSAWKYRARAFRYVLLDGGHVLENLLLALASAKLANTCHYDFSDETVARLIGLDGRREAGLAWVNVSGGARETGNLPATRDHQALDVLPPEIISAGRVSRREVVYDEILEAYRAGKPKPGPGRMRVRMSKYIGVRAKTWMAVEKTEAHAEEVPFAQSILSRRSKRNYISQALPKKKYFRLLDLLCRASRKDGDSDPLGCLATGLLTGNIEGIAPGFYLLDPQARRFGQVISGNLVDPMASVCLDQKWLAGAALQVMFLANLKTLDQQYGARGYRYAMLNAGRLGQLIYLGATALGLGCCGIGALYDTEAQKLLGLNRDSALLYLVAVGVVKRL